MKRSNINTRIAKLTAIALFAIASTMMLSNQAQAQARVRVIGGGDFQEKLVVPPKTCCSPKLGFVGEMNCHGMLILEVKRFSLAERAGLEPGDVIKTVNGRKVRSHQQFKQLLQNALIYHQGHADMLVKNVRPYPPIAKVCIELEHTCRHHHHGGVGHGGVGH